MAQGLITLLSLCLVMAGASFLAGVLPLALNLSASRLRTVSTIGMGVLVGTSLIVIIPEGVDTLYSSSSSHSHARRGVAVRQAQVNWQHGALDVPVAAYERRGDPITDHFITPGVVVPAADALLPPPTTPTDPDVVGILNTEEDHKSSEDGDAEGAHHAWIGIALIAGFILMFIIDKLPQYTTTAKPQAHTRHISLTNLGRRFHLTTLDREEESDTFLETARPAEPSSAAFATTIGLVIHAAADGIALGASSSAANHGLSVIIFFAIMVHKAPAAFGLTSVLLKQGLSKRAARAHLLIFSLAAPTGAFLTYLLANIVSGGTTRSAESSQWWTGVLLLFSAGTFLYVAMHSMQEVMGTPQHKDSYTNGTANGSIHEGREMAVSEQKPSVADLGAACFGMILPLFLQIGHAH